MNNITVGKNKDIVKKNKKEQTYTRKEDYLVTELK
jgi:hypothetical protein